VLVGLSVTDLATSLHRLVQARHRVEWDWLPLSTALLAAISVLDIWWDLYGMQEIESWTFMGFLSFATLLIVLFLLNASALPDDVPSEGLNLQAFYEENSSYFWFLFATDVLWSTAMNVGPDLVGSLLGKPDLLPVLTAAVPNLILVGLFTTLALVRNRLFHGIAVVAVLAFLLLQWSQNTVGTA
jgi:hypothetical protein